MRQRGPGAPGVRTMRWRIATSGRRRAAPREAVLAVEALDPARGVDELLLAREERMARRAELDVDRLLRGARLDDIAAGADDLRLLVARMNTFLHGEGDVIHRRARRRNAAKSMGVERTGGWVRGGPGGPALLRSSA